MQKVSTLRLNHGVSISGCRRQQDHVSCLTSSVALRSRLSSSQADDDDLDALSFGAQSIPLPRTPDPPSGAGSSGYGYNAPSGPSNAGQGSTGGVSGNIGSGAGPQGTKTRGWGGVKMETRYTGESTLDEPVSTTIVRASHWDGSVPAMDEDCSTGKRS